MRQLRVRSMGEDGERKHRTSLWSFVYRGLLVAKGIATRSKDATSSKGHRYWEQGPYY